MFHLILSVLPFLMRMGGGSVPYSNAFMVGPKSPRGLTANGMSCIFEL